MSLRHELRERFIATAVRMLVKEHRGYRQRSPNDIAALREVLRPGDVVLVEGSQRISEVIKYLTQSSWSHAALYVGDAVLRHNGAVGRDALDQFGDEADSLLVEATVEYGVAAAPLSKYVDHNMRICRPVRLRPDDLRIVVDTVIAQVGMPYNVEHVLDLMRYFFPVALLGHWRRQALRHSGTLTKEVICSSQIAMAFQKVGYPVQPTVDHTRVPRASARRLPGWLLGARRRGGGSLLEEASFTPSDPTLITPRDFDLSPYFQVVKPLASERSDFDYKRINWRGVGSAGDSVEPTSRRTIAPRLSQQALRSLVKRYS
jgi:hypothetical protein